MKRSLIFIALGASASCWAIDIPRIGYARDPRGMVRAIDGVSGNFLVGDPVAADAAVAFAWNGSFGVRKTETAVELWDSTGTKTATFDAAAGAVVIGFDRSNAQTAWMYSRSARTLWQLTTAGLDGAPVSLAKGEEVLAVSGSSLASIEIALRRGVGIFVATFDKAGGSRTAERALGGVPASLQILLLPDGSILGVTGAQVWLRRADGSQWMSATGHDVRELAWMGREWIQLSGPGVQLALRIRAGSDPVLYIIPAQADGVSR